MPYSMRASMHADSPFVRVFSPAAARPDDPPWTLDRACTSARPSTMGSGEAKKFRAQYGSAGRHGAAFWTEESDNVGMKLLKGMGWQDGQGLGKAGQGNTSLVKQFRKKDNAGVGGNAATRDDAFRASQDLFAGVLARLNGGGEEASGATAPSLGSAANSIKGHLAAGQLSRRFTRAWVNADHA